MMGKLTLWMLFFVMTPSTIDEDVDPCVHHTMYRVGLWAH